MRSFASLLAFGAGLALVPASAQEIDTDAERILRSMTDYMAGLPSFTVKYDADTEVVDAEGQKLQFSASGMVSAERPDKLHVSREGAFADTALTFDGKMISIYGKEANVYGQIEGPGWTIDEAVDEVRAVTGFDASGADLFAEDAYAILTEDATRGVHVGIGVVGGVVCDHLAFRNPWVDWQIWIQQNGDPLPLKYVITTKWVTGAPQYSLRLSEWNVAPRIESAQFMFTAPDGAKQLQDVVADALGEFLLEGTR